MEAWNESTVGEAKMVLHRGGQMISKEQLEEIPLPDEMGGRYAVVPHAALVDVVEQRVVREFDVTPDVLDWRLATSHHGQRLFASVSVPIAGQWGPAIAFRNSYDRSTRFGFGIGAKVFICDNLALSGDFVSYSRVHTGEAWKEIEVQLISGIARANQHYRVLDQQLREMQEQPCTLSDGWRLLGEAVGKKVLTITQFSKALKAWHDDTSKYGERKVYRLYNEITEQLKENPPNTRMGRQVEAHRMIVQSF